MDSIVETYVRKSKRQRQKRNILIPIFIVIAVVVAGFVFWQMHPTADALTEETYCGMEEHVHSEECYEKVLVCGMEEGEGAEEGQEAVYKEEKVLVCPLEESEGHTHTDDCYDEDGNLICTLEESEGHTHTDECYETKEVLVSEAVPASEGHHHTDECYEEVLVCDIPEHTHTAECYIPPVDEDSADEEETAEDSEDIDMDSLLYEGDDYTVVVSFAKDDIPDGAELKVEEYTPDTDLYQEKYEEMKEYYSWSDLTIGTSRLFDISLLVDGEEIEPDGDVSITISLEDTADENDFSVLHFSDETEEIECENTYEDDETAIEFSADSLSLYFVTNAVDCYTEEDAVADESLDELITSGFFHRWDEEAAEADYGIATASVSNLTTVAANDSDNSSEGSDQQIPEDGYGGTTTSDDDDGVSISKTIEGTDLENVFDITLNVTTTTNVARLYSEPDVALVLVLDVSDTMRKQFGNEEYGSSTDTRIKHSVLAAEDLIDEFAEGTSGISTIGIVLFNTNAEVAVSMTARKGSTDEEVENWKATIKSEFENAIEEVMVSYAYETDYSYLNPDYAKYYGDQSSKIWNRFTDIEAGIQAGYDQLNSVSNSNKYMVVLTDGMPTTYMKRTSDNTSLTVDESQYQGYYTYMSNGTISGTSVTVNPDYKTLGLASKTASDWGDMGFFYDNVGSNTRNKGRCLYGTDYSETAAVRAASMATKVKNSGIEIYTVGVDVSNEDIDHYDNEQTSSIPVIDRKNSNYAIGGTTYQYYQNWLKESIGSGQDYYYDSEGEGSESLSYIFGEIFQSILSSVSTSWVDLWEATDLMPSYNYMVDMEFVGFYTIDGDLQIYFPATDTSAAVGSSLSGSAVEGGENTAGYTSSTILWDIKTSGFTTYTDDGTTYYVYELKYRIRAENELDGIVSGNIYDTNTDAELRYEVITEDDDGNLTYSGEKRLAFKVPKVYEFLGDLVFSKTDQFGEPADGAVFTLTHDEDTCEFCRGDGESYVDLDVFTATASNGEVVFEDVPSGHWYTLQETYAPDGYKLSKETYAVEIAYGVVTVYDDDGNLIWEDTDNAVFVNEMLGVNVYKYAVNEDDFDDYSFALGDAGFIIYYIDNDTKYYGITTSTGVITDWTTEYDDATIITTDSDGLLRFSDLYAGNTYYIKEVEAPDGYILRSSPFEISLDNDGNVSGDNIITLDQNGEALEVLAVGNTGGTVLPETGVNTYLIVGAAVIISAGAAAFVIFRKKKRPSDF